MPNMPTFLRMTEILSCSMADILPYLVLLFYPFRNHLRLKGIPAVLLTFPLSAVLLYSDILAAMGMPALLTAPELLVRSIALLLLALICVRAPIHKLLLNSCSVINFLIMIHMASQGAEPYSLRRFVMMLVLQAALLIPYGINLVKCLGPTLNLSDAPIWKYLWAAPALVTAVGCVLICANAAATAVTVTMAIGIILAAIAAAAALYLTKTEMITLILRKEKPAKKEQAAPAAVAQMPDPVQMYYTNLQTRLAESDHNNRELLLQVMSMESDLEQQNYEQLAQRLNFMRKQLTAVAQPSGNSRIDPILTYYTRQALLRSIKIAASFTLPEWCEIADEDMAVLISCLMDNALDACTEQTSGTRRIAAATNQKGNVLQIGIKNTCTEPVDSDNERLEICRRIAERYDGDLRIMEGEGVTQIVVTLTV